MSLIDNLLALIAPHDCLGCGVEGSLLCALCRARCLPPAKARPLALRNLARVQAATPYQGIAKDLLWRLKSAGAQSAATSMASQMKPLCADLQSAIIVPVVTANSRARTRGYDQARLLARALVKQTRLPYLDCLARHGQAHQVGASRSERLRQLHGALRVTKPSAVRGAHIILIDDVITTGATLEAAAMVLKAAGASRVEAITFAQA